MAVLMVGTLVGGGSAAGIAAMDQNMVQAAGEADMGNGDMNQTNNAWKYMYQHNKSGECQGECMEYQWQHNYGSENEGYQWQHNNSGEGEQSQWQYQYSEDDSGERQRLRERKCP